mmetsp:Transcript_60335/g.174128  ORF Transcript_60335/g.174128 Transcript_60335/m.174128 type:complete len:568 (-) Transcript_60335:69-1772(-)|eukprot:CAMPEP_0176097632 /NCGR_PEP_ID=MMETSP0120_2-20121206/48951_1 /TAXON_ID=160619 /ORGANISM="Kryptoperidinium foliaceum, Strain CCMP 1326" /LENGTH=567 /DNA_ID=CAMNT_0017431635 /DNA_START=136 /DNA_END=1839 /DNA_ORIENTATION=-
MRHAAHVAWELFGLFSGGAPLRVPDFDRGGGMIAAANPDAVEAGLAVLRAGGDAVDAAVAVQLVLGLVEPQSSGIGGGGVMVRYDNATGEVMTYDGRETAPSSATETMFLDSIGEPLSLKEAWRAGCAIGVPGLLSMLALAHGDHGRRQWAELFQPAILLADGGFRVAERFRLNTEISKHFIGSQETQAAAAYLFNRNGTSHRVGHKLRNPDYARSLRSFAKDWRSFYRGEIAEAMVAAAREAPLPGGLSLADLAGYKAVRRRALCPPYRGFKVCSVPPPSSGGVALGQLLGILDGFDLAALGPSDAEAWRLFIEASRLAYADRDHYVGDPAFAPVPVDGLLNPRYLAQRAELARLRRAMPHVEAGEPPGAPLRAKDGTPDATGTTHFVIVDARGNVVSMTTSVARAFGSGRMVHGFFLNNQLSDFAFVARAESGQLAANAAASGKRPRSSMSPAIVLDGHNRFVLATGSPGGSSIVAYTAKTIVAMLDWGLTPQEAAALPNVVAHGDVVKVEAAFNRTLVDILRSCGFFVESAMAEKSGIHIVAAGPQGRLVGGADPRRDGVVASA